MINIFIRKSIITSEYECYPDLAKCHIQSSSWKCGKEETNKYTKMRGRVNTVEKDCEQLCEQAGTSKMNYSVRNANGPAWFSTIQRENGCKSPWIHWWDMQASKSMKQNCAHPRKRIGDWGNEYSASLEMVQEKLQIHGVNMSGVILQWAWITRANGFCVNCQRSFPVSLNTGLFSMAWFAFCSMEKKNWKRQW